MCKFKLMLEMFCNRLKLFFENQKIRKKKKKKFLKKKKKKKEEEKKNKHHITFVESEKVFLMNVYTELNHQLLFESFDSLEIH